MARFPGMNNLFQTVVADPPWPYNAPRAVVGNGGRGSDDGRAAKIIQASVADHYDTMSVEALCALPVQTVLAVNAHLYLWTTNSFLVEAHQLAMAWGFVPKTLITWGKIKKDQKTFEPSMKTGYWYRSATEHVLFAVRGKLRLQVSEGLPTLLLHERLPHSVKPSSFQDLVEKASPGPYLEMFARRERQNWSLWGNQAPGGIMLG